MRLLDIVDS